MAKNETKTTSAKATSTKPAAAKEDSAVKKEETAAKVEVAKEVAEKAVVEDTTDIKEEVAAEPKKEAAKKKPAAKKKEAEKVEEVYIQFHELEITAKEVIEKAKQAYVAEGHRESSIKSIRVYIKPEEKMAYYVINDKVAGGVSL